MMGSRPVVGSSKRIISGSIATARAKNARNQRDNLQGPGQAHPFALAAREFGRHARSEAPVEAHLLELFECDLRCGFGRHVLAADQPEGDVLQHGHAVEQCRVLEQHAEFAVDVFAGVFRDAEDGLPVDLDL
ncbi:MAG: hypothetical protein VW835_14800, partial [Rickettsiales bacterium]